MVTFNDEPLSDSQQQAFDEVVEITETLDENGDPVVTVNMDGDQLFQEFRDGVLEVMVSGDENNEAVSSDLVDSLLTELGADADQAIIVVGPPGAHTAFEISLDEKPTVVEKNVVNLGSFDSLYTALDSLRAAKIGSQSPGVIEGKSWGRHQESRRFHHGRRSLSKRLARPQAEPAKRTGPRSSSTRARFSSPKGDS